MLLLPSHSLIQMNDAPSTASLRGLKRVCPLPQQFAAVLSTRKFEVILRWIAKGSPYMTIL